MADMKVAYILHQTTSIGGGNKSFMEMLKGLMQKGVQPYIIMPNRDDLFHDFERMNIPTFVTTFRNNAYPDVQSWKDFLLFIPRLFARIIVNQKATNEVVQYLRDKKIDLIHTNVSVCNIGYKVARKMNLPHIYHVREYGDKDFNIHYFPSKKTLLKSLESPMSYTIFITKDIQKHFHQESKPASRVIYNGIQPRVSLLPTSENTDFFLFAGKVKPPKGLLELIIAYNRYKACVSNNLPLYVAGDTEDQAYYKKIQKFISDNHLNNDIKFLGVRKDINSLMRQAKAIIIPSWNEGFGRCMAEAMFNGCLCIGHNTGGTKEQMDNGISSTGQEIALRYNTEEQLVQLLCKVSNSDKESFLAMKERAFQTVNNLYSSEANIQSVLMFYHYILKT